MKVIGIIAEYNPFHNGHLYQIQKVRRETNADYIVIVLSGDFLQRGVPALLDKYTRSKMALACGADLIIELPVLWSTASAQYFAAAGIACLDRLGVVSHVCFGAESPDMGLLSYLADLLAEEPPAYRAELDRLLKTGEAFPTARAAALSSYLTHSIGAPYTAEAILAVLNAPNNILSIEYLKALKSRNSGIKPYPITRVGASYHETDLSPLASATAIRSLLAPYINRCPGGNKTVCPNEQGIFETLSSAMPKEALSQLRGYMRELPLLDEDAFSSVVKYKLLLEEKNGYADYADCTQIFSNRIAGSLKEFVSFSGFCKSLRTRDVTHSRLNRIMTHILLNITKDDYAHGREIDYIPYFRILGVRQSATPLFRELKCCAPLPLITKTANAGKILSERYPADSIAHRMFEMDIFAADLYASILTEYSGKVLKNEYNHGIIIQKGQP